MKFSNILFLFIITGLLALPASYEPHHFAKALLVGALMQSFAYGSIMLLVARRWRWLKRLLFTVVYILFCVETFLFLRFGSRLDPNMLTMALQTNMHEAGEFVSIYLVSLFTLVFLIVAIGIWSAVYQGLDTEKNVVCLTRWAMPIKCGIALLAITGLAMPFIQLPFPLGENTFNRACSSFAFVIERHGEVDKMTETIDKIEVTHYPDETNAPVIVLVIGESFNKMHSSLYGYDLPTSPNLENEQRKGQLLVYDKAMSPTNGTDHAMRYIFSLKGCEPADTTYRQYVLFPAVFKKAGYRVAYFDNQYTRSSGGSLDYSCGYFLNPQYINDNCFDFRNSEIRIYDGDFVALYKHKFLKQAKSLNIIHLMGQHFDARLRYPTDGFSRFTYSDIKRSDLRDRERRQVADYDNATLYNDYVVNEIICSFKDCNTVVVYLSDHGEQVYEGPNRYFGRGFGSSEDPITVKSVYEVPFMLWCSDTFIKSNSSKFAALRRASNQRLCTADLAYLLFDLADIDFNYNVKSKSCIDKMYRPHLTKISNE